MEIIIMLAIAIALDAAVGEPPNAIHPVAWMGKVISLLERAGPKKSHSGQFIYGIIMTLFTTALFTIPVYFLLDYLGGLSLTAKIIVGGVLLKFTFSINGMRQAAMKIRQLLENKKLADTKYELRALVSRDTKNLSEPLLASAAVESVAEGTVDSIIAPMLYFLVLGVPGAISYRVINTLDSMIGYRGKYEYLGKFASRLDDVLNFIPARIAALLLVPAAFLIKRTGWQAWRTALHEHVVTESPNAGWPMAAMAGALNTRLEKPEHYILGEKFDLPTASTINDSVRIYIIVTCFWTVICMAAGGIYFAVTT